MKLRPSQAVAATLWLALPGAHAQPASFSAAQPAPPPAASAPPPGAPADAESVPIPPIPPRISESGEYEHCMDMLGDDPDGAAAFAENWHGGGEAAQHCHALALVALGNPEEGAPLLAQLAQTSTAAPAARAEVFGQAASAFTMAGDSAAALQAAGQAIALAPEDPELRVIHALAALARKQPQAALEDLTIALAADPKRADLLALRATAHRNLNQLAPARADIDAALALDPDNAPALLERGILRQRAGDAEGARRDWQRVRDLDPEGEIADQAEQNLALLEAGPAR